MDMINYRNIQTAKLNSKILELKGSIVTLGECIEEKVIKCLRENNDDLQNSLERNSVPASSTGTGGGTVSEVSFVGKVKYVFKTCYDSFFEGYVKTNLVKEAIKQKNDALDDDLEVRLAEMEREWSAVRKSCAEYQRQNAALNKDLIRQKRDFLNLTSEKDQLSQRNLTLNVEFNNLKEEYESMMQKLDYLIVSLNENCKTGDYSSWIETLDDLGSYLGALKADKERIAALNMKATVEKDALQKQILNGEIQQTCLQEKQVEAEAKIRLLRDELDQSKRELDEQTQNVSSVEQEKTNLQEKVDVLQEELLQTQSSLQATLKELEATKESLKVDEVEALCGEEKLSDVKERNTLLIYGLEKQNAIQQSLGNDQHQLESKIVQLETDLQLQTNLLEQAQQKQDECNAQNRLLSDRISDLQAKNNDLEQTIVKQRNKSENNLDQIDILTMLEVEAQRNKILERDMNDRHEQDQRLLRESTEEKDLLVAANRSLLSGLILIQNGINSLGKEYELKIGTLQQKLEQLGQRTMQENLQQLRDCLSSKQQQLVSLQSELTSMKDIIHSLNIDNSNLRSSHDTLQTKLRNLELENAEQNKKNDQLKRSLSKTELKHQEDKSMMNFMLDKVRTYKQQEGDLRKRKELHQQEQEINKKYQMDNEILRAKLAKNRKKADEMERQWNTDRKHLMAKLTDSTKTAEKMMQEIRTDYEKKLDKLKDMGDHLEQALQKATKKRETDRKDMKALLAHEMKKFAQLEIHTADVQQQLCKVNERNLELMKESEFIKSKLRIMDQNREESKNPKMKDGGGDIFNNAFLVDLKTGRTPPHYVREPVPMSVLNQGNSIVRPHVTYSNAAVWYADRGDAINAENRVSMGI
ncbi:ERC protein 2-like [Sabethes cyaneus]|uniref:ERC protein 2-like n=1 Tax=Sabethes cyaneus TaxID=53552 RepID=UPI00237E177A|nr:ERC protein 2-like [Sabethes cyaneus]